MAGTVPCPTPVAPSDPNSSTLTRPTVGSASPMSATNAAGGAHRTHRVRAGGSDADPEQVEHTDDAHHRSCCQTGLDASAADHAAAGRSISCRPCRCGRSARTSRVARTRTGTRCGSATSISRPTPRGGAPRTARSTSDGWPTWRGRMVRWSCRTDATRAGERRRWDRRVGCSTRPRTSSMRPDRPHPGRGRGRAACRRTASRGCGAFSGASGALTRAPSGFPLSR